MLRHLLLIHILQTVKRILDILNQGVTSALGEILTHNNPHELHSLAMWRHRVGWDDPSTLPQCVCKLELIKDMAVRWIQGEGDKWQTVPTHLRQNPEAHRF